MNRRRRGFSLIELLIVISIILIIAMIAAPKVGRVLMHSREMAAIRHIHTIHAAQTQYNSQFGRYANSLTEMGPPASGNPGPAAADIIPGDLALGEKGGYRFKVQGTPTGYSVNAEPMQFGASGSRTFFSDQSNVIRQNFGPEPANATSPEIK